MRILTAALLLCASLVARAGVSPEPARRVVLLVWDGMRPDFISEATTPTLCRVLREGVYFQNHHSVFVSSTEVNGTAFGTGMNPAHNGVMANREYRPDIDPQKSIAIEELSVIRKGDQVSHDEYLHTATVAEILRAQTPALATRIAGSKPVVFLLDRKERPETSPSWLLAEGETLPEFRKASLVAAFGPMPAVNKTKTERDTWTTRALLENFWADGVPPYSVLWLAEPDWSQHATGPGSETSLAAIRGSDAKLALVLETLQTRGLLDSTDVMIVSDHGFSTIERNADVAVDLSKAGLTTARAFAGKPIPGSVLVVPNGGSANLYVIGHDKDIIRKAVEFLQTQDYTGSLFTREALPGTFALSEVRVDSDRAPDIVVTFRWSEGKSATGTPGLIVSEAGGKRGPGEGNHASLSRYDLHNILVARGPHFRAGVVDPLPSGNVDVAPTILWLLGVKPPRRMDGRVLSEGLTVEAPALRSFETKRIQATATHDGVTWKQYLRYSEVNGVRYLDESNGEVVKP